MSIVIYILSVFSILGTHTPRIKSTHWFIRDQLNFRAVYLGLNCFLLILVLLILTPSVMGFLISVLLIMSIFTCVRSILPFTKFHKISVPSTLDINETRLLKLLISNVYQENKEYYKLIQQIRETKPDIILLLETDEKWDNALADIQFEYQHVVKKVKDDTYGIMLMSKIELEMSDIHYFTTPELPSVEALISIGDKKIRLVGIHPKPPIPGETNSSRIKDHEIIKAGDHLTSFDGNEAKLLIGDLNDVAWSRTAMKLKKETGMEDPRVGRGFYSTFPVYFPIRFPLDHVFCSSDFELVEYSLLEDMGSDHFPVYVVFQLKEQ